MSAALAYALPTMVAILSMPPPPRGPVPARIIRRTSSGACSATIWATPPPSENPNRSTLFEAQGADERDRVGAHLLDGGRHRPAGRADTAVVERDDAVVRGDAVDDARVPVVEDRGQVVQEHHRNV